MQSATFTLTSSFNGSFNAEIKLGTAKANYTSDQSVGDEGFYFVRGLWEEDGRTLRKLFDEKLKARTHELVAAGVRFKSEKISL